MNIEERARKFAEGKALNALNQAIEEAYAEGYRDGYKDREAEIPVELQEDKIEFVDLGLPSGTLWASSFETYDGTNTQCVPYEQAKKYHLPTEEQYKELIEFCSWDPQRRNNNFSHYMVIGRNGNYIKLSTSGYMIVDRYVNWQNGYFWLNDENQETQNKKAAVFWESAKSETNLFSGYGLPVLQVK